MSNIKQLVLFFVRFRFVLFVFGSLFFLLHSSVLEPNFDLPFCERQVMRNFNPAPSCQVLARVELLLKFQRLKARVGLPAPFAFDCRGFGCGQG